VTATADKAVTAAYETLSRVSLLVGESTSCGELLPDA
jgi:hypothetical protein